MDTLSPDRIQSAARKEASWAIGAFRKFSDDRCTSLAASIAFYSAFSLAPTLVMVIAVAGWFFGTDTARSELFDQVRMVLGNDASAAITTIVENAHRSKSAGNVAAIISFSMLAIGASATFSSLNTALNIVWPPPVGARPSTVLALVRVRLISFSLVLGVAFLLIVSLVLDTAITFVGEMLWAASPYVVIGDLLQLGVGLLVLAVAFAALLKFLPDAPVRWRDAIVGGAVAAVLFSAGKKLFALYLAHAGMASAFGAAGSLAVLLMWLYFSAAVLLLGAEFAAARGRLHDPRGAWGSQDDLPPGSRAKLASVLAASTVADRLRQPDGATARVTDQATGAAEGTGRRGSAKDSGSRIAMAPHVSNGDAHPASLYRKDNKERFPARVVRVGRTAVGMERKATRAAADAIVQSGRAAAAANRYVKQHPWTSVLLATGAALFMTAARNRLAGGRHPVHGKLTPSNGSDTDDAQPTLSRKR